MVELLVIIVVPYKVHDSTVQYANTTELSFFILIPGGFLFKEFHYFWLERDRSFPENVRLHSQFCISFIRHTILEKNLALDHLL